MHRLPGLRVGRAVRNTPAQGVTRTFGHFHLAQGHLLPEHLLQFGTILGVVVEAPGVAQRQEVPAQRTLGSRIENKGDDPPAQRLLQEGSQPGSDAGGIHDDAPGLPALRQREDLGIDAGVMGARPDAAIHHPVRRRLDHRVCLRGKVDLHDRQCSRIAFDRANFQQPAIGKRFTAGLLAAHIQQKSIQPPGQGNLARRVAAVHHRLPGFGEHARFGFHFLREEL